MQATSSGAILPPFMGRSIVAPTFRRRQSGILHMRFLKNVFTVILVGFIAAMVSGRSQNAPERPSPGEPFSKTKIFFTIVAALGAAVAAIFTGLQWWTADDTARRQLRAY